MSEPLAPLSTRGRLALVALLAVPAALSWPAPSLLSPFDPEPWIAATGWCAAAALACTVALAWRLARLPRGAALALGPALAALLALTLGAGSEPLESSRALTGLAAGLAAFVLASTFARAEATWLARGLALITLLHGAPTLIEGADLVRLSGALQNTGYTNQVLLPGGAAGAVLAATSRGRWRALGAAAAAVYLLHAGLSPTLLGALALGLALGASALGHREPRQRLALAAVAALALGVLGTRALGSSPTPGPTAPADHPAASASDGDLGGVGVRAAIWRRTLPMVADAGPFGVGPARFRAEFPRYRDPSEARASELGGLDARTEVEHPHNDWLLPWVEYGWLGGLLWTGLLALALAASFAGARSRAPERAALGAAGLAVLVNAGAHSNLQFNPLASVLGLAALGASVGAWLPLAAPLGTAAARAVALAPVLVLLAAPLAPWRLVSTGDALAEHLRLTAELIGVREPSLSTVVGRRAALERALEESADSDVLALQLAVAEARRDRAPTSAAAYVARLVALRPHSIATLEALAVQALERGDREGARAAFEALRARRPGDADAAFNLVRLELEDGAGDRALAIADDAGLGSERRTALARDAQLGGWVGPETAAALLEPAFGDVGPDALFERAERLRDQETSPATRAALECLARHLWAREHAAGGDLATAARVYRQAWRASRDAGRSGSPLIRLELIAAERLAGNEERAQALSDSGPLEPHPALPPWAAAALPFER